MVKLTLSSIPFVKSGHEKDSGEYAEDDRSLFYSIRKAWPELSEWGDFPLGTAWGSYSQETLSRDRLLDFIAYIKWHEVKGEPEWGQTPEELLEFAKEQQITA
jgi:hypothetical protein